MISVKREGVLLAPTDLFFENKAVLNPGIYQEGNTVHVVYRAINDQFVSHLGYAKLEGPTKVAERWNQPFMAPKLRYEKCGLEDPRIVKIDDTIYMTYVAHDGKNAVSAYAAGPDLFSLKKEGIISPKIQYKEAGKLFHYSKLKDDYYFFESFYQEYGGKNILIWHKDVIFFPEKINNKFVMMQRILPDIQIAEVENLEDLADYYFWVKYLMELSDHVLLEGKYGFEARHVGGGCPPIKTDDGWLVIFHGTEESNKKRIYHASAVLLDLENPQKIIGRLRTPLISPQEEYELTGQVNNVIFPTGTATFDDRLYIYYGAADCHIAVASVSLKELINELLNNPPE